MHNTFYLLELEIRHEQCPRLGIAPRLGTTSSTTMQVPRYRKRGGALGERDRNMSSGCSLGDRFKRSSVTDEALIWELWLEGSK